ncbi:Potassium voltage-gated channel subfamily KQT member 5 [Taenia crassiceps]|uniref:Potassium voltage-gated channel subfamily KQT member 5 n=1 Tax=Taenia crassiceps TaxID=6207 RepID=A0ABR4QK78_9CEST
MLLDTLATESEEYPSVVRRTSLHGKALEVMLSRKESFYRKHQAITYNFLERPKTKRALIYHSFVFASVLACLITSVLSTIQEFTMSASRALIYMELVLLFWFFIEYIVRMWSAGCRPRYQTWRGRLRFARRPFCIVDIILIVASVIVLASDNTSNVYAASALRGLRFFQILRMIRVDRRAGSFKLLASVVWAHRQELFTTMYIGFLALIFGSFLIYLVEKKDNMKIQSFADALWWGIITLCTVGYGDTVPKTWIGKIIAAFCAIAGISFFALPAGILGSGFALKVQQQQRQKHLIRRRVPAATLIQCMWRCYAADKKSTSIATWNIYKPQAIAGPLLHPTESISERSSFGRFGQRLSSIRRKAEKLKLGSTTPGSGLRPVLAQANLSFILPSPLTEKEDNHLKSLEYAPTHLAPPVLLRKVKSEYKIDESRRKFLSARQKDSSAPLENSDSIITPESSDDQSGSSSSHGRALEMASPTEVREDRIGIHYFESSRSLTEKDKVVIRVIRKIRLYVARRKFREALRPYDVKDVIEQYSAGHLDMVSRVKILQSRLDTILGRQGGKSPTAYNSHISLAARIVGIESNLKRLDKKMDIVMQLCQSIAGQRPHTGSLPPSGIFPLYAHKPPHRSRETSSPVALLRTSLDLYLDQTRSHEDLSSPPTSSSTLCPSSLARKPTSTSSRRGEQSVSFSCETVLHPSQGFISPKVLEAQAEGVTGRADEENQEEVDGKKKRFEAEEDAQSTTHGLLPTTTAAVLHRHTSR